MKSVLDGGSLKHIIKWAKNMTYNKIAKRSREFVSRKCGVVATVFGLYEDGPSTTEDMTHFRKCDGQTMLILDLTKKKNFLI